MDCVAFFIWRRRVKIRTTFTCRQLAREKARDILEALEQREVTFRPLEIWGSLLVSTRIKKTNKIYSWCLKAQLWQEGPWAGAEQDWQQFCLPCQRSQHSGWMFIVHAGPPRLQLLQMCWERSPRAPLDTGGPFDVHAQVGRAWSGDIWERLGLLAGGGSCILLGLGRLPVWRVVASQSSSGSHPAREQKQTQNPSVSEQG